MAKQVDVGHGNAVSSGELRFLPQVATDITSLTASWKEVLGIDLAVIHDAPPSSGQAVAMASSVLAAIRKYDRLLQWSRRAFNVAFIHDVLMVVGEYEYDDKRVGDNRNDMIFRDLHGELIAFPPRHFAHGIDVPISVGEVPFRIQVDDVAWDDNQNQRRCDLIDKEIDGTITGAEQIKLLRRHARLRQHLDKVAPVPLEGARKLHEQLLEKKRKQERQD